MHCLNKSRKYRRSQANSKVIVCSLQCQHFLQTWINSDLRVLFVSLCFVFVSDLQLRQNCLSPLCSILPPCLWFKRWLKRLSAFTWNNRNIYLQKPPKRLKPGSATFFSWELPNWRRDRARIVFYNKIGSVLHKTPLFIVHLILA